MSLFDRHLRRNAGRWRGVEPPPLTVSELLLDLRWHRTLYRNDGLPRSVRAGFLALRAIQRISYGLGWWVAGGSR